MLGPMKICIVGAGAIGGWLGTRLACSGPEPVAALARGDTLAALRQHGWRLDEAGRRWQAPAQAESDAAALGPQDLVVLALKAQALPALAPTLAPLLTPATVLLPAMNGVPWWFFHGRPEVGEPLDSVDPGGQVARHLPPPQVLGAVVHASVRGTAPGLATHVMGRGLIVGEPAGGGSARLDAVVARLRTAGLEVTASADVRRDAWYKLWGNLTMNPVSAITGATIDRILADTLVRDFCSAAMVEAAEIGGRIGCPIDQNPDDRHAITAKLGAFRTSMLQDVDAGRPIELDPIVGVVHELGQRLGVPTPHVDALLGLTRLFARVHRLYPDAP